MHPKKLLVNVPVANLRRQPSLHSGRYEKDLLQESQVLFGEKLLGKEEKNGWIFVEAIEQKKYNKDNEWEGYPGWIQAAEVTEVLDFPEYNLIVHDLWAVVLEEGKAESFSLLEVSFGTNLLGVGQRGDWWIVRLHGQTSEFGSIHASSVRPFLQQKTNTIRNNILEVARKFISFPYLWGGRSAYNGHIKAPLTSLDCSGLTHLLYRVHGIQIPRDAHDQYLISNKKEYSQIGLSDLVFLAENSKPERITHVMLNAGWDTLLEAVMDAQCVRLISAIEKLGKPLSYIENGEQLEKYRVFFGTFL